MSTFSCGAVQWRASAMVPITIAYGEFSGHQIPELPDSVLAELAKRFPLEATRYDLSEAESLLITVAVHEELARRASGGRAKRHIPTVKEFAVQIVAQGFRALSKVHHPDVNGDTEAQRRLIEVRDLLTPLVENIDAERTDEGIRIPSPRPQRTRRAPPTFSENITDNDVPF